MAQEKKEEAKRRKAELILKQKKEGTFLTKKQKAERAKAQRLFENQGGRFLDKSVEFSGYERNYFFIWNFSKKKIHAKNLLEKEKV